MGFEKLEPCVDQGSRAIGQLTIPDAVIIHVQIMGHQESSRWGT